MLNELLRGIGKTQMKQIFLYINACIKCLFKELIEKRMGMHPTFLVPYLKGWWERFEKVQKYVFFKDPSNNLRIMIKIY